MEKLDQYLIVVEIFQLLLFSAILFFERNSKNNSKKILGLLFFVSLLVYGDIGLYYLGYSEAAVILFYLFSPALLMILPLFYLYIKSLTSVHFTIEKRIFKHFILSVAVFLIATFFYAMTDKAQKIWFLEYGYVKFSADFVLSVMTIISAGVSYVILPAQLIFYTYHIVGLLKNHKQSIGQVFSNFERRKLNWIRYIILLFFVVFIVNIILLQINVIDMLGVRIVYNSGVVILTFFLGFAGISQSDIYRDFDLADIQEIASNRMDNTASLQHSAPETQSVNGKGDAAGLSVTEKQYIIELLDKKMANEKLFLDPDLKIADVAKNISVPVKNISLAINEHLHTNFYNYVNGFRIEEAKSILSKDDKHIFSIEGIAEKSGFHSRSSFYSAFKKYVGKTPSEYRMQYQKK